MTEILAETADELLTPEACIQKALAARPGTKACFTNSFQAEDMVVLHLLRQRIPDVSVLFLDTGYHFRETYEYRDRMTAEWNLNLVNVMPRETVAAQESKLGLLYLVEPAQCCNLRKVEPLFRSSSHSISGSPAYAANSPQRAATSSRLRSTHLSPARS